MIKNSKPFTVTALSLICSLVLLFSSPAFSQAETPAAATTTTAVPVAENSKTAPQKVHTKGNGWNKNHLNALKAAESNAETPEQMGSNTLVKIKFINQEAPSEAAKAPIAALPKAKSYPVKENTAKQTQLPVAQNLPETFAAVRKKSDKSPVSFYVGLDAIGTRVTNSYKNPFCDENAKYDCQLNNLEAKRDNLGGGINLGAKIRDHNTGIFASLEVFYDHLNNKTRSPWVASRGMDWTHDWSSYVPHDSIKIDNRVGAKINIGFKPLPKIDIFATAGMANVKYRIRMPGLYEYGVSQNWPNPSSYFYSGRQNTPIFGGGIAYNINEDWDLRLLYERQILRVSRKRPDESNGGNGYWYSNIETLKIGVARNF